MSEFSHQDTKHIKAQLKDNHTFIFNKVSDAIHYLQSVEEAAENGQCPALSEEEEKELKFYHYLFDRLRESSFHVEIKDIDNRVVSERIVSANLRNLQDLRKEKNLSLENLSEMSGISWTTVRRHFSGGTMSVNDYFLYKTILEDE